MGGGEEEGRPKGNQAAGHQVVVGSKLLNHPIPPAGVGGIHIEKRQAPE